MNTVCCQCIGISYMRCACVAYQRIRTRTNGSSSSNSSRSSSSTFCIGMFTLTVCVYMNSITCQTIHICCMRTKVIHKQKKKKQEKQPMPIAAAAASAVAACSSILISPVCLCICITTHIKMKYNSNQHTSQHIPNIRVLPMDTYIYVHKRCYRCMWNWLIC